MSSGNVTVSYVQVANALAVTVDDGNNHTAQLVMVPGSNTIVGPIMLAGKFVANEPITGLSNQGAFAYGTLPWTDTGIAASWNFPAGNNSYVQVDINNQGTGALDSADFCVSNGASTTNTNFADFGINSPGFVQDGNSLLYAPSVAYLYSQSVDLVIGTNSANAIHLLANNATSDALTITSGNKVSIYNKPVTTAATSLGTIPAGTSYTIKANGSGDFADLNAFETFLASNYPLGNITVNLEGAVHSYTVPWYGASPFSKWVTIQGATKVSKSVTSIASNTSLGGGKYAIILNVNSTSGLSAGMYTIITAAAGGSNPRSLNGCWPITNVGSGQITVTVTAMYGVPSGATTATIAACSTVLSFTGCDGYRPWDGPAAYWLQDIVFVGDGTAGTAGISCQDHGRVLNTGVLGCYNFDRGIYANYNSQLNGGIFAASNCTTAGALITQGAVIDCPTLVCNGNNGTGIWTQSGGIVTTTSYMCGCGNQYAGIRSTYAGSLIAAGNTPIVAYGNAGYGLYADAGGAIDFSASTTYGGNGTQDIAVGAIYKGFNVGVGISPVCAMDINGVARLDPQATLPGTPYSGMVIAVNTALSPVAGSALSLGGSAYALAWYNNAQWTVLGA